MPQDIVTGIKGSAPLITSLSVPATFISFFTDVRLFLNDWIPPILGIVSIWAAIETVRLHRAERRKITMSRENERRKKQQDIIDNDNVIDDKRMQ